MSSASGGYCSRRSLQAFTPAPGLDPGWMTALNLARTGGLRFGSDVTFTYGPWGWLDVPVTAEGAAIGVAVGFSMLSAVVVLLTIRNALRRSLPSPWADVAATASAIVAVRAGTPSFTVALALVVATTASLFKRRAPGVLADCGVGRCVPTPSAGQVQRGCYVRWAGSPHPSATSIEEGGGGLTVAALAAVAW